MSEYLKSCQSEFWKPVFKKELEYILRELKGYKNVLSVGCGPAIIEKGLQENGFNVTGLDVSKVAFEGAPDSIRTVIGSAEDMDCFEDSSFDAAIYVASLQFIKNYEKAIQETARVLRPGGRLLVMLLNPQSEFVSRKIRHEGSTFNRMIHKKIEDIPKIEKVIFDYFDPIKKPKYFLGIKNQEVFDSTNPKFASLYVIKGHKKEK